MCITKNGGKERIRLLSGLKEGKMLFKYLGIPLSPKRFSIKQYQLLIERIVSRISNWTSILLNYSGRIQLIHSTRFSILNNCVQTFCFPENVLKDIESICRKFLGIGKVGNSRKSLVALDNIFRPGCEGGQGIMSIMALNKMAMLTMLWAVNRKEDKTM